MAKNRVSLTLEGDILKKVDRLVGDVATSRSGVVEELLEKSLVARVPKTAAILVGSGKEGTVLEEYGGKSAIDRHVEGLGLAGVSRFVLIGSKLDELKDKFRGHKAEFLFVNDKESGTAGALKRADHIIDNTFFVVYGDTVSGIDYSDLYKFHMDEEVMATVALTTWREPQKFGIPDLKGTRVVGFKEKPEKADSHLVSSGSFVMEPEVLDMVEGDKMSLEKKVLPRLASIGQLAGYVFSGSWIDLG